MYHSSKYGSKKTEVDGIVFDSKKEANRYSELKLLERAGEIKNLEMQKEYILIPTQYYMDGKKKKVAERECKYKADFVYTDKDGVTVVEDTKGFRTKDYLLKRKLMLYVHGIRIMEV